ncbi:uncharacterized protein [Arachis hypogaea]|uniref:uncharacterized protein n=1 Tax=Arachis hypogaea TaxID=3818 RepID=UPI003B21BFE6
MADVVVETPIVADGEFAVGMEFSSREAVIKAMKEVSMINRKYCWVIRRYNDSHTCTRATISQDYSKLDSNTIAEVIKSLVEADPSLKVKLVIAEVLSKFNYTVSYRKAWLTKQNSVEKIFRGWEASYEALPIWLEDMCHKEPSAVVHFETMPAYQGDDLVDVTHLYGKYKGCLYIESNFLKKFKAPYLQKLVVNIGYSRTVREYEVHYQRLRERDEAYTNWLNRIPPEQYALAFDGSYRWGHMTTNLVECINSALKGARNLPITALVKAIFYRLNELFTWKRVEAETQINAGHIFSELVTSRLHANQRVAGNI